MDHNNQRGQILIEALVGLFLVATLLFTILNQLQFVQKRTKQYGISKETHYHYSRQRK